MLDKIIVKGARVHNLKNIDVEIPRNKLVVITGLSGSGKSSLAFDTIYAEGQRRYVESLSSYARQFLGQMDKPDVDYIEGLSPAISIDQKARSANPRSTVGTVTEIYDYLRLLFARIGEAHCPNCEHPIAGQTIEQMVDQIMAMPEGTKAQVLAPVVRGKKGEHTKVFDEARRGGFVRVRVDGELRETGEEIKLDKNKKHTIEIVVDRLVVKPGIASRLADSLETAVKLTGGLAVVDLFENGQAVFSQNFACVDCGFSFTEIAPRLFSFNSPFGACPTCTGLGVRLEVDPDLVIPDRNKSLYEGAVAGWSWWSYYYHILEGLAEHYGFDLNAPVRKLDPGHLEIILYGTKGEKVLFTHVDTYGRKRQYTASFEGVVPYFTRRFRESTSDQVREEIEQMMRARPCPDCGGTRLKREALAVKVGDRSIAQVSALTILEAARFCENLRLTERQQIIGRRILKEIRARLGFLINVGLDYLTLDRAAGTLSGGEAQRIRLATQIGSGLMGVLYILDEPSIGLHPRDNARLLETLANLRDLGNTLIVVEHDEETMRAADHVIDIGPGAGRDGGRVVASGPIEEIINTPESLTGRYLSGRLTIPVPSQRRKSDGRWVEVTGARAHNLQNIDVAFPLGLFVAVTGVSGSGKSTLVNEILYKGLAAELNGARANPGRHQEILGLEHLDKVINIDQSPIGRTPRSNPATYTNVFTDIRELFSLTPEARVRGYKPGRFSFNVRGGRCEACQGDGIIKIEMHFLPDVYIPCEVCKGRRYNRETLEVKYKGRSIAEVLEMTVDEACDFFSAIPKIHRRLKTLQDVGLGYVKLGQPATTLSGGEAQRVKLAAELSRRPTGRTLYILDEPTTGLHFADIARLLQVLHRLVDGGNTVVVIEHNLDVIKTADYIIDLGPEGGDGGGRVVATGTPEQVAANDASYTGGFLRSILKGTNDEH
ncbi:excinuclease ABC subunit UvrA [Desulforudis sp. 1088]|uniref:excinuclease ABC subunit UvrA n=2 Tax=Candidatus Desulforudis TaxID=471826 RepID=UPI003CE575A1